MNRLYLISIALLILYAPILAVDSTIAGVGQVRDTYLQDRLGGDDNYGGAGVLFAGWKDDDYPNSNRRMYLYFSLPSGYDTCQACTLSLHVTAFDGDPDTIDVYYCTRDVSAYCGNNTTTSDAEDGEMTWLSYFDDDDGIDSAWTTAGGDFAGSSSVGSLIYAGNEAINQYYRIGLDKNVADSLLDGSLPNYGFFLVGRVGGAYGSGNTLVTANSVNYGDGSYGPTLTFYTIGAASSGDTELTARRRR